jgi:glycosyltransferase involved in cell wall biosynthesis
MILRSALFSNAHSAHAGGGVFEISAWAQALRQLGHVDLVFASEVAAPDLASFCGVDLTGVSVGTARRRTWFGLGQMKRERAYNFVVRQSIIIPKPTFCRRGVLLTDFPMQREVSWRERQYLKSYSVVVANSEFTSFWITQRWRRSAVVINPPIMKVPSRTKMPWIVSVGRFTSGKRSKHQLEMVLNFRRMLDEGVRGWELHLCGGADDPRYVEKVGQAASGLPVRIHAGVPRQELDEILGHASIFWHGTGINYSEQENPELMEHFGMSVAEAMAAGCVPVVVGRGGLTEVVGPDLLDWTWQSWDECIEKTKALIENSELRGELAAKAQRQAESFGFPQFAERVRLLVRGLVSGAN